MSLRHHKQTLTLHNLWRDAKHQISGPNFYLKGKSEFGGLLDFLYSIIKIAILKILL